MVPDTTKNKRRLNNEELRKQIQKQMEATRTTQQVQEMAPSDNPIGHHRRRRESPMPLLQNWKQTPTPTIKIRMEQPKQNSDETLENLDKITQSYSHNRRNKIEKTPWKLGHNRTGSTRMENLSRHI